MGIENLSLRLKNTQSFTLEEMIFLICGIDPMTLTQAEDRHLFWGVTEAGKPLNTLIQYWVTGREKSDFEYVHNLIRQDKLDWIAIGMYNHDNPEIHIQESNSNPENISSVARSHQAFMNAFNRSSETAKELFKVQIEGFNQTSDYKSTLKSLQTEMLIPQFMVDDLDWLTLVSGELGRDLTGAEVQAIKRVYEYEINDFWQHRAKSDKTFSKQNIASYLVAKQIESVFDFGQSAISPVDTLAQSVKPVQRTTAQDDAIKAKILQLGHALLALPKNIGTKAGVKAEVRTAVVRENPNMWQGKVFDKAWQRLRDKGEIGESATL